MSKQRATQIFVPPFLRELAAHAHAIDRLMHEPARLVLLLLGEHGTLRFQEVLTGTALRPGNLSAQGRRLEAAGSLEVLKSFRGRYPATSYRLTPAGQAAWDTSWSHLHALLLSTATPAQLEARSTAR